MSILREKVLDNRFLRLIENLLKAGYSEDWTYHASFSGSPQGGIITPPTMLQNRPSSPTLSFPGHGSDRSTGRDGSPGSFPIQGGLTATVLERMSEYDYTSTETRS